MVQRTRPPLKLMEATCRGFNKRHPVGSEIIVYPGAVGDRREVVTVVEPGAYVLGNHTAVVQVTGGRGCIAISHVLEA